MLFGKVRGCLYGGAVGDALGAPAEWKFPPEIRERYGEIVDLVEPWDGPSDIGKGDGRFTDDTHMTRVLSEIYTSEWKHLDPFIFAERVVPLIADEPRWLAERGQEMLLVDRLFYPEKWLLMRLRLANADPRLGGVGNMVNCGAAMYASPVGIVNACDPVNAYREGIEIFSAHQWSYGLETAAVMAACVAEAFRPAATVDSVIGVALDLAKEGTKEAIAAVTFEARWHDDWRDAIGALRDAIRPFDGSAEDGVRDRGNKTDDWAPSRRKSIEEVPVALGFLLVAKGDFEQAIFGAANYGRDNDSIAGMAGAIAGALHGDGAIRPEWITRINDANRVDLDPLAHDLTELATALQSEQLAAARVRAEDFKALEPSSRCTEQ
ncbi:MAG: ADP-ribosylglycohydrolase family protein [Chloroflexia bacterium]|nr:ADP-ribosylglycohydrolase family protein [Chloroflexia bacterium]